MFSHPEGEAENESREGRRSAFDLSVMAHVEELFCDALGLFVFGSSYVYAFEYLLSPGSILPPPDHPLDRFRMDKLNYAADRYKIEVDPSSFSGWVDLSPSLDDPTTEVIHDVLERSTDLIQNEAMRVVVERGIKLPRKAIVNKIRKALEEGRPYHDIASLPEIINAGWLWVRGKNGITSLDDFGQLDMIQDLMLKTIEVSEILTRASEKRMDKS